MSSTDNDPKQSKKLVSQAVIDAAFALSKLDGENGSNSDSDSPEKDAAGGDKEEKATTSSKHTKNAKNDVSSKPEGDNSKIDIDNPDESGGDAEADGGKAEVVFNNNKRTFPEKLMKLMASDDARDVIVWLPEGRSFTIVKPDIFVNEILPKYFKQAQLSSFVRRLHRWGFRQLKKETGESTYEHDLFLRDDPNLCLQMCCTSYSLSQKRRTKIKQEATREYTRQMELAAEAAKRYHVSHLQAGMPPHHGPPPGYPGGPPHHYPPPPHHYGHPYAGYPPPHHHYGRPPPPAPAAPSGASPSATPAGGPHIATEKYDEHTSPASSRRPPSHGATQRRPSSGPPPGPYSYPGVGEHGPYGMQPPPHHHPTGYHPHYPPPPGGEHHHPPHHLRGPPPYEGGYGAPAPPPNGHYDSSRPPAGAPPPGPPPDYGMHAPPVPPHRYEYM